MEMQLKERMALVTDGNRDVGRQIALSLAAKDATIAVHGEAGLSVVGAARAGVTANTVSFGLVEAQHDPVWLATNRDKLVKFNAATWSARRHRADCNTACVTSQQLVYGSGHQY
jgi:NAD(P)-dependent dehydrogenase (short-subunit alcohol dehydrogenase family)